MTGVQTCALPICDDEVVGDQLAAMHVPFGASAQLRPAGAVSPEDIAGRDLFQPEAFVENARLRALTSTGRSQEDDSHVKIREALPFDEAAIVAHRQTRLDLRDRVERHADDD